MTAVTLADIEAAHNTVAELIATFKSQAEPRPLRVITIAGQQVELQPDEHYAGIILGADGAPSHHLVLLPGDVDDVNWEAAKKFATEAGGELPTRREQALLFANLKDQFEGRYYWSSEQHASNDGYAWDQHFNFGNQDNCTQSAELRARAVRRLTIQ